MFHPLLDDDMNSLLGSSMRQMNTIFGSMNSMFGGDRFGMIPSMPLMPFGVPAGNSLMPMMDPGMNMGFPNMGSSFSSTMMTISSGPDGRPQVYKETSSTIAGPGGIRETKKSVQDSRSGKKKMSIGHYIGERGHIKEREQNIYSGNQEENEELINLEEEEAEGFNREFEQRAHVYRGGNGRGYYGGGGAAGGQYAIADAPRHYQQPSIEYYDHSQHPPSPQAGAAEGSSGYRHGKKKSHHSKPYVKKRKSPK